jgi:RNA 3'-terminal phosphate cyclase (ATP)
MQSGLRAIDGSYGEGGGQLLRSAVALSAITGVAIRIHSIRARRSPPGLAPQHLAAVRAVARICGASSEGLELRSTELAFAPGPIRAGEVHLDVGTAGSVTLVLQALAPVMLTAEGGCRATITGGTDVRAAPPLDYVRHVFVPLLSSMGAELRLMVERRGYYPRGGGVVHLATQPATFRPLRPASAGTLFAVEGLSHVAHLPAHIADRMRAAAIEELDKAGIPSRCDAVTLGQRDAAGPGGAVVLWARREHTVLGAGRVAERGIPAEALGAAAGAELAADLTRAATLDVHAADQLLIYCALARGESWFTTRALSSHARAAIWLIRQFVRAEFHEDEDPAGVRVTIRSEGTR